MKPFVFGRTSQFRTRLHSSIAIAVYELKHGVIDRVETGHVNEMEFVAHRPLFTLKLCDTSAIEMQDYHSLYWSKKEPRSITSEMDLDSSAQQKFWGTKGR
jgi:hypothetical protein